MEKDNEIFWSLLRTGLWGKRYAVDIPDANWKSVYTLSRRHAVTALVTEGMVITKNEGKCLEIRMQAMNYFIRDVFSAEKKNGELNLTLARLSDLMKSHGITPVQIKGQGYCRNYPKPLLRTPGDIDFLLDGEDYDKAVKLLSPLATKLDVEYTGIKHFAMFFDKSEVELHGTLHSHLSKNYNRTLDEMQAELFDKKDFRFYDEGESSITIPSLDFDATFLFAHIVQHLYDFGLKLKQFCDWAMFLHVNHDEIDMELLNQRLRKLGILEEWKTLGCLVVEKLGLPESEMPFFDSSYHQKAERLSRTMLKTLNVKTDDPNRLKKKMVRLSARLVWISKIWEISPSNTLRAVWGIISGGTKTFLKGE